MTGNVPIPLELIADSARRVDERPRPVDAEAGMTHFDHVRQRRTDAEGAALLAEALLRVGVRRCGRLDAPDSSQGPPPRQDAAYGGQA